MIDFKKEIQKDRESLLNVHKKYDGLSIEELGDICIKQRQPYSICLLNMTGDLNISVCIRTASMLSATRVLLLGRRKYDKRSTVGAQNYIDVIPEFALNKDMQIDTNVFWQQMEKYSMVPIPVEQGGIKVGKFNWGSRIKDTMHPCLVFGNEGRGIPQKLLDEIEQQEPRSFRVSIPQHGVLRSYNVSSAMAITTFDLCNTMKWI